MRHSGLPIARLAPLLATLALGVGATSCGDDSSTAQRTSVGGGPTETSPEPGLTSYRDTRAETDASSDIRNVVVSSDEAGLLSFKVTLAAEPDRHTAVLAYLDTDRNAATGTSAQFGADYELAASQLSQTDATFSLRRWNGRRFVDVPSVYPDVELRGRVVTLGFANADRLARSFRFALETRRRPGVLLDRAPDLGQAPLTFEMRGKRSGQVFAGRAYAGTEETESGARADRIDGCACWWTDRCDEQHRGLRVLGEDRAEVSYGSRFERPLRRRRSSDHGDSLRVADPSWNERKVARGIYRAHHSRQTGQPEVLGTDLVVAVCGPASESFG